MSKYDPSKPQPVEDAPTQASITAKALTLVANDERHTIISLVNTLTVGVTIIHAINKADKLRDQFFEAKMERQEERNLLGGLDMENPDSDTDDTDDSEDNVFCPIEEYFERFLDEPKVLAEEDFSYTILEEDLHDDTFKNTKFFYDPNKFFERYLRADLARVQGGFEYIWAKHFASKDCREILSDTILNEDATLDFRIVKGDLEEYAMNVTMSYEEAWTQIRHYGHLIFRKIREKAADFYCPVTEKQLLAAYVFFHTRGHIPFDLLVRHCDAYWEKFQWDYNETQPNQRRMRHLSPQVENPEHNLIFELYNDTDRFNNLIEFIYRKQCAKYLNHFYYNVHPSRAVVSTYEKPEAAAKKEPTYNIPSDAE